MVQFFCRMVACPVHNDGSVGTGRYSLADLFQVNLHGSRIAPRLDPCHTNITGWTDGPKNIGCPVALVCGLAWPCAPDFPFPHPFVFLPDPRLVLKPDLDRRAQWKLFYSLGNPPGELFLKSSITPGSCKGCSGRPVIHDRFSAFR